MCHSYGSFTFLCMIHCTSGDADIVLADAATGQILNTVHVNQKVRKLLAVGKRQVFEEYIWAQYNCQNYIQKVFYLRLRLMI